jgi:UDP-N-acetylglucosamine 2-epimerase (non-hydrolysing)
LPTLPYHAMLGLLDAAALVVTDSGGLQEEAVTIGVPVVVTREETERPEVLATGLGRLTGTDPVAILAAAKSFLDSGRPEVGRSPFGDGRAGIRAAAAIAALIGTPDPDNNPSPVPSRRAHREWATAK